MVTKTTEYWLAFLGMVIYLLTRDRKMETLLFRVSKTAASGLIALGSSKAVSNYFGVDDIVAAVFIMAFGLIFLDLVNGFARDREFIKGLIKEKFGGKRGD